ncbi:hypothetical protein MLD38_003992 [Melastoma candidum]|uniref:Uncharacterized protein n=1 Tax=Melastoma candidum TaxID=119954 RepID=A0ACB9SCT5_9MYRT|nr:hypothetical protein MLD38_003992 [Melastoma candidum]
MAPLRSLEKDYPLIDADFQGFCASHGILTVEDLLIHDLHALLAKADHLPRPERFRQAVNQVLCIVDGLHRPWLNGIELLRRTSDFNRVLSTGCGGVDSLLNGGLQEGQVTELAGPSSSGKTQFCLLAASTVAAMHLCCVMYLDTGNSFSSKRVAHFVSRVLGTTSEEDNSRSFQQAMSRILCCAVFDIFSMFALLHQLEAKLKSQVRGSVGVVRLLIIDSISSLISPILSGSGSQGRALMISAGALLKKLANEYNIAVANLFQVINHTVGGENGFPKPALGETWKTIPHVRLMLSHDFGSKACHVSILKHISLAPGASTRFVIE